MNQHQLLRERKVEWMLKHRELWEGLNPEDALYINNREAWRRIADGLKVDGLISMKTGTIDVPVKDLIREAQMRLSSQPRTAGG